MSWSVGKGGLDLSPVPPAELSFWMPTLVVSVTGLSSIFACLCLNSRVPSFMTDSTAPPQAVERTGRDAYFYIPT